MYDELIEALRKCANPSVSCKDCLMTLNGGHDCALILASNAITALTAKLEQAEADLKCAVGNMAYMAVTRDMCTVCKFPCKEQRVHCGKFEWKGAKQC